MSLSHSTDGPRMYVHTAAKLAAVAAAAAELAAEIGASRPHTRATPLRARGPPYHLGAIPLSQLPLPHSLRHHFSSCRLPLSKPE
jgi:hypothetical protein